MEVGGVALLVLVVLAVAEGAVALAVVFSWAAAGRMAKLSVEHAGADAPTRMRTRTFLAALL